jgi:hypothetical protein
MLLQQRSKLRKLLVNRFTKDELRTLCFDLDLPYEDFPDSASGLAREMLVYCEKRDRVPELIEAAREMRPDIDWTHLGVITAPRDGPASGVWKCPADVRGARFVGSLTSRKVHAPECGWARRIAAENRVCFDSIQAARSLGYVPCRICEPRVS